MSSDSEMSSMNAGPLAYRVKKMINNSLYLYYTAINMDTRHNYKNLITEIPATAVEVYRMLPEGTRCEVIFNELIMSPSRSREHQFLLIRLTTLLFEFLNKEQTGTLLSAPFDVYFKNEQSIVQPDLFMILNADSDTIKKNDVFGVPAIIIEIISTNRAYDTQRKRALYEKAGVKEYFMIDPENKGVVLLTLNASGKYEQAYQADGILNSALLSCNILF